MRFTLSLVIFFLFLFQCSSNDSNLIPQSCNDASNNDPNLTYDFCVSALEANISKNNPPTNLEDLVGISIQITQTNGTNMIANILKLLNNQTFSQYAKACLQDCLNLYKGSISTLNDAYVAFKAKDFGTANIKLGAALDTSTICEDQFKDKKGEVSPLTKENKVYFQLNVISMAFVHKFNQLT
ncbi:putative pectinesterase inhibitor domain-containing protein [Lupinus albus]|uniref:Putative pectinesterase inhibitor domain-containing protein n=1 Tax=Lupinus albus TaxID=3870 RepID=A0A6A4P414_LUPAL|nr:putative pectinesterase inhibitor domain-containing protein [Lupinus albus]